MKFPRIFSLILVSSMLFLAACTNAPSAPLTPAQQAPTQQPATQEKFPLTIASPDFTKTLKSPVTLHGKVSGLYFFEGTFPVVLKDPSGKTLAQTVARADDDWMTDKDVNFTAQLIFKVSAPTAATLVFEKDNPSGLPENDYSRSFDVHLQ